MLKKFLTTIIVLAATATAWADGYGYTLDKDGARATITTGEQTLEEVITAIKGLTPAVQYVILPDGMTKADVNRIATENGFVVAVSKNEATTTETKWVYTYNGEEFIYEGTPTTTDGVSTANVKVLVDLTETKFSYTLDGQPYNGTVFFDPQGNCYGVQNADDVFALTKIKQGYTYNDNGIKVYTGATRTDAKGKIYGNTGEMLPLTTTTTAPWTYECGRYIYEGEYISGTNGNVGGTFYELKKVTATAENPVYTYDNDNKLHIGEVTESGDQHNKTYTATIGNQIITVYPKTSGDYYYYTKDGENHIYRVEWGKIIYTKLDGTGQYACEGGTIVYNVAQASENVKYYTDNGKKVVYTGNVYTDNDNKEYGVKDIYADKELTCGDIYFNGENIYTGYRDADNTKGCNNPQPLTTSFTYKYENPNTGEIATLESENHLTTYEVDYTVTVKQKEIEMPTGKIHLIAYVSIPGSLVDGISDWAEVTGTGYYKPSNVTALTLSGTVNAKDVLSNGNYVDQYGNAMFYENGEAKWNNSDSKAIGYDNPVALRQAPVTYIDLENAYFPVGTDMNFAFINNKLQTVILPTHKDMTEIPERAFNGLEEISELCIPYNYTTIGSCAFHNTHALMHIYTTDNPEDDSDDETIVDNGPYTYTFSANLKEIEGGIGVNSTFFGNYIEYVTDIYVLAEEAPLCGANAFAGSMTYGNNGFAGNWTHPICRENYINSDRWICVLHYPSSSTDEEAAKYTDITRNYTLIDEVGNVDGDGRPIAWPRHAEFYRAYNQAINGYIWYDWKEYDEGATEVIQIYDASKVSANPTKYDQAYQGWHEFVLVGNSRSRDFDPQKENSEYIQRDWYTICVPYDLTKSQLLNMLGVVNSEAEETVYALEKNEGKWEVSETGTAVTQNLYPDVRALTHVSRDINENGTYVSGKVTLHLSEPLISVDENGNVTCSHVDINEDGQGYTHATLEGDDPIVMEGGHAYLIRPYVPKEWNDQIKNLGMYIMAMADSYNNAAVSAGLPAPYSYNEDCKFENKVYLPCFKHKIHAVKGNGSPNASARNIPEFVYEDAEGQSPAYYRFVGTYTQTTVPQYAYYLGKNKTTGAHQFFRTTKETTKWNPYSAVIVGLSSNPNYTGVDTSGKTGIQSVGFVSDNENDLRALAGEVTNPSNAGKSLSFEQLMGDANGEATGIVDVNVNSNVNVGNNKVYSINGQYMGTSLNKLPKGIYIINGQKKVVK